MDLSINVDQIAEATGRTSEAVKTRRRFLRREGRMPPSNKDPEVRASAPRSSGASGGKAGNVVALGNLAWMVGSFPVGLFAPPAGHVMRQQVPSAGQQIDALLKGTAIYDALTSGGKSNKAVAGVNLFGPVVVAVAGHFLHQSWIRNPESPIIPGLEAALEGVLVQMLSFQGITLTAPPRQSRPARRGPAPEPEVQTSSPGTSPSAPAPHSDNGFDDTDDASAVAQAAAAQSRFDHVE